MGNNIIANIIAQSTGITNGDKSLAQKAITRNTIPICRMISKICLLFN
jgi:hypothetical protein